MAMTLKDHITMQKHCEHLMGTAKTLGQASLAASFTTLVLGCMNLVALEKAGLDVEAASTVAVRGTSLAVQVAAVCWLAWILAKTALDWSKDKMNT